MKLGNKFKRIFLFVLTNIAIIFALNILVFLLSYFFGINLIDGRYSSLAIFAMVFGFGGAFISLMTSKWMAKRFYKIKIINKHIHNETNNKIITVYETVKHIAHNRGIKIPEVGIYDSSEPNAFATGPSKNNSIIAVSTGLLEQMNEDEIKGVVGHEMAHILNGDMVTMTLLQGLINTFVIFLARIIAIAIENVLSKDDGKGLSSIAYFLLVSVLDIVLGFAGMLVLMGFSRHREFKADEGSADLLHNKEYMIKGLKKLKEITNKMKVEKDEFTTLKIAGGKASWFSTHPSIDDRINNLMNYH